MYSISLYVVLLLGALLISTSEQINIKQCFEGCNIVDQVLKCNQLQNNDLHKLTKCIKRHHGPLIVDVRSNQLSCTCEFLDFAMKVFRHPRNIVYYDTYCQSQNIRTCGANKGMEHKLSKVRPVYSFIGGKVFDVTDPDFENQLTTMDNEQIKIIESVKKISVRKRYHIAQESVIEKAILDSDTLANPVSQPAEKTEVAVDRDDEDDPDENKDDRVNDQKFDESAEDYGYSTLEKEVFIFICLHVTLMTIVVITLIIKTLRSSGNRGQVTTPNTNLNCVSNNMKGSEPTTELTELITE